MARLTYPGGGAYLTYDSITWKSGKDWKVDDKPKWAERSSNTLGKLPPVLSDLMSELSFMPMAFGASIAAQFAALYPFTNKASQRGTMVFPSSDLPAVINTRDGKQISYPAGMVTKMPQLTFSADKALFGDTTLSLLLAAGAAAGAAASHDTVTSQSYSEPAMSEADELRDVYTTSLGYSGTLSCGLTNTSPTATQANTQGLVIGQAVSGTGVPANTTILGITPGVSITLSNNATATATEVLTFAPVPIEADQDGVVVTPTVELEWIKPYGKTTQQARIKDIGCDIEFTPLLMDVDTFYASFFPMQGANISLGASASLAGLPLAIAGSASGKAKFNSPLVMPIDPRGPKFDDKSRIGKVKLKCGYVSGSALFTLGTV